MILLDADLRGFSFEYLLFIFCVVPWFCYSLAIPVLFEYKHNITDVAFDSFSFVFA